MVEETIHVMDADETTSEAFKNYATAAFLVGMAVLAVGIGAGMLTQSIRNLRKTKSPESMADDLIDRIRKNASEKAGPTMDDLKASTTESLRKVTEELLGTKTFDQIKLDEETYYYVKKSHKDPVKVGDMLPEAFVVEKPGNMTMDVFLSHDNVKFKTRTIVMVYGGTKLITVEEIVNSDTVKPV